MESLVPVVFDTTAGSLEEFKKQHPVERMLDTYREQIEELFLIRNPRFRFVKEHQKELADFVKTQPAAGSWFYFPWGKLLAHYLPDALHQELRTARNKNLITAEEQEKFYNFKVGIAGLSVGSHAALTIAMMGGGRMMKLADPDEISGSNLNRIRYDFTRLGQNKCAVAVEQIYQMNPYSELVAYPQGISQENIIEFLAGLDVLVEETDNLELKIRLRLEARKLGIPVLMATDNGDNVIVDIERYDLDRNLKLFNGAAGDLTLEEFQKFPPQELPRLATKIAGPEFVVPRMLASLQEVGKTLYSWPQLGDAATLAGVAVAYLVKRLALGEPVRSGKLEVNLDKIFDPNYQKHEQRRHQKNS